jgi:putative endonuclease
MKLKTKGNISEVLAAFFLTFKFYRILKFNYKNKSGQIDIIAKKGQYLCFVEVKYRNHFEFESPVQKTQKRRIVNSGLQFQAKNKKYHNLIARFDIITINKYGRINHYISAWS